MYVHRFLSLLPSALACCLFKNISFDDLVSSLSISVEDERSGT